MFEKLGYVCMRFDMPGCGESEGENGLLLCPDQVTATSDALTLLAQHPNVDGKRIAVHGFELRCRGRGLLRRRRSARGGGASPRRAGAMASASSAASIRAPEAWAKFTAMLEEGRGYRARTGKPLMVPRYDIVPIPEHLRTHVVPGSVQMFPSETAQSMFDFRANDVVGKIAPRPLLLLHTLRRPRHAGRAVDRAVRARRPADRAASVRRHRPLHVRGRQHAGAPRGAELARQIFPGRGASRGGVMA